MPFRCQVPILRSRQQNVSHKYGDFQKASTISLREPFITIKSVVESKDQYKETDAVNYRDTLNLKILLEPGDAHYPATGGGRV